MATDSDPGPLLERPRMDLNTAGKWYRFAEVYNNVEDYPKQADVAKALGISDRRVRARAAYLRSLREADASLPELINRKNGAVCATLEELRAAEAGLLGTDPVLPGFRIARTSVERDADGETVRSWVEQKRAHGEVFELPVGQKVKGISALVDERGREVVKWIKTGPADDTANLVDALKDAFAAYEGIAPLIPAPTLFDSDLLTLYPLPDLHVGMHSWAQETGESYDLDIITRRAHEMASDLIGQSRPSKHAVILGLGDLFHMNDQRNMTPRSGHILDVDGRWPKVYEAGIRIVMNIIELAAQKHERVTVRILPGNHDPDAASTLAVALRVFYAANPRIEVDSDPSLHWFYRFGQVLFGATHGHTMKPDRMAMMLATDRAADWGTTEHKHFFFGHIHHESAKEVGPVRVESFNTIAAKDAYAHGAGHRSGQALNALTFHKARGEVGRHRVNLARPAESTARLAA